MKQRQKFAGIVTWLSVLIILLLVIGPPIVYFFISFEQMVSSIETEGAISAITIMKIISLDPYAWEFEQERLQDVLSSYPRKGYIENWRTFNAKNKVIAKGSSEIDKPFVVRSFDLMDSGVVVGRLEISRSIRPLLHKAIVITLFMLPVGAGALLVLYLLPIRTISRAEDALMKSKQLLEKTFASLQDAIFIIDYRTGKIVDCNPSATGMFGYKREELLGQTINFLHVGEKESREFNDLLNAAIMEKGFLFLPEFNMKREDGTVFPAEHSILPLEDERKKLIGWVSVMRDITDRKIMEDELLRAQKLESLAILAGGIAHDFNNLMTGVLGNISLLKNFINRQDKSYQILENAERAALKTRDLTMQILTFSKGGTPIKKVSSIVELAKESAHLALSGSNVRCKFSVPEDILPVEIDEGQVDQVLGNLIINADQSMPEGGIIEIQFENIRDGRDIVPFLAQREYVKISIKDHGSGIVKEYLPKIFDPYFTTKQNGSGLGLAIAYSLVKRHGGHIAVESEIGVGTTFHIYLPASREKFTPGITQEKIPLRGKGNILVMDDREVIRDAAKLMLSSIGYDVVLTKDGSEAIAMYKKALQSGKPFDAVILDLTVPGGIGGKEAVKKMLEIDPNAKAIVSSGYSNDPVMSEFKKYGFVGLLEKPYRMQELRNILLKVIETPS